MCVLCVYCVRSLDVCCKRNPAGSMKPEIQDHFSKLRFSHLRSKQQSLRLYDLSNRKGQYSRLQLIMSAFIWCCSSCSFHSWHMPFAGDLFWMGAKEEVVFTWKGAALHQTPYRCNLSSGYVGLPCWSLWQRQNVCLFFSRLFNVQTMRKLELRLTFWIRIKCFLESSFSILSGITTSSYFFIAHPCYE